MTLHATIAETVLIFAIGAAVGFVAAKRYYDKRLKKEIQSVKSEYERAKTDVDTDTDAEIKPEDIDILNNSDMAKHHYNYNNITSSYGDEPDISEPVETRPYRITFQESGDRYDDIYCYRYYRGDGTVTDEMDTPLLPEEIADTMGFENLNPEEPDDVIYVRNDIKRCDYEITFLDSSYEEEFFT